MMSQAIPIIGQAVDVSGRKWDVTETRPTIHGFDLLLGWPSNQDRGKGYGRSTIILTRELVDLVESTPKAKDINLPAETQHIRKRIGMVKPVAKKQTRPRRWWTRHKKEMLTLTLEEFAQKYRVSKNYVWNQRRAYFGLSTREFNTLRRILKDTATNSTATD